MKKSAVRLFVVLALTALGFGLGACSSENSSSGDHPAAANSSDTQTVWGSREKDPHAAPIDDPSQDHHAGR